MRSFKIYSIWPQTDRHTHHCNAVQQVWGSLRLAPTIHYPSILITMKLTFIAMTIIFIAMTNIFIAMKPILKTWGSYSTINRRKILVILGRVGRTQQWGQPALFISRCLRRAA